MKTSFASAANYLNRIGWKKNQPCFFKIDLKDNIPNKYLNSSARNIKNKKKVSFLKKYIKDYENLKIKESLNAAIIIPDKDIIPGAKTLSPAYIVFENYEKILNWNRSLRFALAVCTLKESFKMKFKLIISFFFLFRALLNLQQSIKNSHTLQKDLHLFTMTMILFKK